MLPLFEMMANAQGGNGMEALSRQFGLSPEQTRAAVEALMPAFSQGLKRNTADPYGLSGFMNALATGNHARYFEDASRAFSPEGIAEGNGILGHLFGSKELSRAVASQAAQATGIGQNILKQMLPVIATMIMGGLFKQSTGQMAGASADGGLAGGGLLGQILEQMMQGGLGGTAPSGGGAAGNPFGDNPLGQILEGMLGGAGGQRPGAPQGAGDNPLGRIFEEMLGGAQAAPEPGTAPQQANPSGRARTPYDDLFGKMFEAGASVRDEQEKAIGSVFDQFLRGMDRNRR